MSDKEKDYIETPELEGQDFQGVVMGVTGMSRPLKSIDVAQYILDKMGTITSMKLQKLVYYCQAWSLVWDEKPLFNDEIQAWVNGPVTPNLYKAHQGLYEVNKIHNADPSKLGGLEQETVDAVLDHYGGKTSQWLSDLTHIEKPWKEAREGLPTDERGDRVITQASMAEYYSGLYSNA